MNQSEITGRLTDDMPELGVTIYNLLTGYEQMIDEFIIPYQKDLGRSTSVARERLDVIVATKRAVAQVFSLD